MSKNESVPALVGTPVFVAITPPASVEPMSLDHLNTPSSGLSPEMERAVRLMQPWLSLDPLGELLVQLNPSWSQPSNFDEVLEGEEGTSDHQRSLLEPIPKPRIHGFSARE
jgi:hypothetical protein